MKFLSHFSTEVQIIAFRNYEHAIMLDAFSHPSLINFQFTENQLIFYLLSVENQSRRKNEYEVRSMESLH